MPKDERAQNPEWRTPRTKGSRKAHPAGAQPLRANERAQASTIRTAKRGRMSRRHAGEPTAPPTNMSYIDPAAHVAATPRPTGTKDTQVETPMFLKFANNRMAAPLQADIDLHFS